jgi:hypothetical protein
VNIVVGVASFTIDVQVKEFSPNHTPVEKFKRIGFNCVICGIGFAYVLWRNEWRFGLKSIVYLALFWCATYGALSLMQFRGAVPAAIAVNGIAVPLFVYCICWATKRQRAVDAEGRTVSTIKACRDSTAH